MALEAVPFAGLATILAVTALEVKDACDNMRDIDGLRRDFGQANASEADTALVCGYRWMVEVLEEDGSLNVCWSPDSEIYSSQGCEQLRNPAGLDDNRISSESQVPDPGPID